tara:strand:+ start:686 stop:1060 length:375 start_codon:yes stop_codon:yes gene_type:complete
MVSVLRGDDNFDSSVVNLRSWTSGNINWARNTSYTINHTLGVVPKAFSVEYVCVSPYVGYAVGDTVFNMAERYANWGQYVMLPTSTTVKLSMLSAGITYRRNDIEGGISNSNSTYFHVRVNLLG